MTNGEFSRTLDNYTEASIPFRLFIFIVNIFFKQNFSFIRRVLKTSERKKSWEKKN